MADSFEDLFTKTKTASNEQEKQELPLILKQKMILLAEKPLMIDHIKTVNPDVGQKLEVLQVKIREYEKTQQRGEGLSL